MFFTNFLLCFPFFYFFLFVYVLSFFLSQYVLVYIHTGGVWRGCPPLAFFYNQ